MYFTKKFWIATAERVIRGAVIGAGLVVGDGVLNAFTIDWAELAGYTAGGAVGSLILSLGGLAVSKNGPAFTEVEVVEPRRALVD